MDSPVDLKGSEREHFKSELLWYLTDSRITPLLFLTTASATELLQHTNGCICQLRLFIQLYRSKATTQPQHSTKYMECFNNNIEAWRASVTYCQMRRDDNVKFLRNCIGPRPSELVDEGKRWFPFGVRLDSTYCTALALHHYPNHQMPAGHHSLGWSSTPAPWAITSACKSAVGFPNCWMPEWVACPNKPKATNWSCSISWRGSGCSLCRMCNGMTSKCSGICGIALPAKYSAFFVSIGVIGGRALRRTSPMLTPPCGYNTSAGSALGTSWKRRLETSVTRPCHGKGTNKSSRSLLLIDYFIAFCHGSYFLLSKRFMRHAH